MKNKFTKIISLITLFVVSSCVVFSQTAWDTLPWKNCWPENISLSFLKLAPTKINAQEIKPIFNHHSFLFHFNAVSASRQNNFDIQTVTRLITT